MDRQGAQRLVERIACEPDWQAETSYSARSGEWTVKAWGAKNGKRTAPDKPDATFTTPYEWYYLKASFGSAVRRMKALQRNLQQRTRLSRKAV